MKLQYSKADPDCVTISLATMNRSDQQTMASDLLAMLAHDLKNPIGAIFGYADILLDTPTGVGLNDKQNEILSRIRGTSSRCMELIRNYLYLAQSQDGKLSLRPVKLDLNNALRSVIETTWRDESDAAQVSLDLCPNGALVQADNFALERMLANLFSNALQYSPPRGEIKISTRREENSLVLEINNQGQPIAAQDLPHIFERFYRATNSKGIRGSGLGLYIVQQIASALQVRLSVDSNISSGTTFRLEFNAYSLD